MRTIPDNSPMPDNADTSSTRRWARFQVEFRIKARFTKAGKGSTVFGQGSDLSEGGMSAYLAADFVLGEVLELEMTLPYAQRGIFVRASVRNRDGYRYGIEFLQMAPADKQLLQRSLKALALVQ